MFVSVAEAVFVAIAQSSICSLQLNNFAGFNEVYTLLRRLSKSYVVELDSALKLGCPDRKSVV